MTGVQTCALPISTYFEVLDTNQELRSELQDEISNNRNNEKRICSLVKELEQCYKTITFQDSTILAHENEIEELKLEISSLKKRLCVALQNVEDKEKHLLSREEQLYELEDKVKKLKTRIHEITGISQKKVLTNRERTENSGNMDNTLQSILDGRLNVSACVAEIRLYLDGVDNNLPDDIATQFDDITTSLTDIIRYVGTTQRYWEDRGRQLTEQTT